MRVAVVMLLGLVAVVNAAPTTEEPSPSFPCICTMEYMPVCGVDGVTYGNSCGMKCAGVAQDHTGACTPTCACPKDLHPVCGSDGKTYDNACLMKCAGVVLAYEGMCVAERADIPCICPFIYLPVCGDDGITYGNECSLKCVDGVTEVSKGECPTPAPAPTSTQAPSETTDFTYDATSAMDNGNMIKPTEQN